MKRVFISIVQTRCTLCASVERLIAGGGGGGRVDRRFDG